VILQLGGTFCQGLAAAVRYSYQAGRRAELAMYAERAGVALVSTWSVVDHTAKGLDGARSGSSPCTKASGQNPWCATMALVPHATKQLVRRFQVTWLKLAAPVTTTTHPSRNQINRWLLGFDLGCWLTCPSLSFAVLLLHTCNVLQRGACGTQMAHLKRTWTAAARAATALTGMHTTVESRGGLSCTARLLTRRSISSFGC
jgi:hypothetical protein